MFKRTSYRHIGIVVVLISTVALAAASLAADAPADTSTTDASTNSNASQSQQLSVAEVRQLVEKAGKTKPDWWDDTPLEYPDKLDIQGTQKVKGWRPDVNLGAYVWSVINPKQANWHKGARLMHYVIDQRPDGSTLQGQAMDQLAHIYCDLLGDYPRAAYWYERVGKTSFRTPRISMVKLAECYWRIGSRSMAERTISTNGLNGRNCTGPAAVLMAQMGDSARSMALAKRIASSSRRADEGLLAAARISRLSGDLEQAAAFYKKLLTLGKGSRYLKQNQTRATESLKAVEALMKLDLSQIADGTYTASAHGYRGEVNVEVTITNSRVSSLKIGQHKEDVFFNNFVVMPQRIVDKGDLSYVDAVTGASVTSDAIMNAAVMAVAKAARK